MILPILSLFLLFPAYAGVIPLANAGYDVKNAFPRVCGGDPDFPACFFVSGGFSPRMRG